MGRMEWGDLRGKGGGLRWGEREMEGGEGWGGGRVFGVGWKRYKGCENGSMIFLWSISEDIANKQSSKSWRDENRFGASKRPEFRTNLRQF